MWQQFVSSEVVDKTFCAVRGSGQGRVLNSDLADKHFYHLAEENFVVPERLDAAGVHLYARYRDDVLLVVSYSHSERMITSKAGTFIMELRRRANATYDFTVEASNSSVVYLDLVIYKGVDFDVRGRLDFRQHFKLDNRTYIASDSFHSRSTLRFWPVAELGRLRRRSSTWHNYAEAKKKYLKMLLRSHTVSSCELKPFRSSRTIGTTCGKFNGLWLVLPYHPAIRTGRIKSILKRAHEMYFNELFQLFGSQTRTMISFENSRPNMAAVLRSIAKVCCIR